MQVTLGTYFTTPEIRAAVDKVLDSGRLSYGPVSKEYECKFAEIHDCKYGVVSNSGTSSLVVALQAMKEYYEWEDGDEVIVPALTFVASVNAVLNNNLTPVLVDVHPLTYNIELGNIPAAITKRTRAIMPVHLFGQPANMPEIVKTARLNGLRVIEDSCEAIGVSCYSHETAEYKRIGAWGDIGCFSTYTAHHLVTGVGGMATTNNQDLAMLMRSLVNHGIDLSELPNGNDYEPSFLARKFRFNRIGHSFRITELEAAIGLAQLDKLTFNLIQRCENAQYLTRKLFGQFKLILPLELFPSSWMVYPLVLWEGSKWPLMEHLQKHGIECREMVPLTNQPCYNFREDDYPVAKHINKCGFYVGIHQDLTLEHLDYVAEVIGSYYES